MNRVLTFLQENPAAAFVVAVVLFALVAGRVDDRLSRTQREQEIKRRSVQAGAVAPSKGPTRVDVPVQAKFATFPPERHMDDWPTQLHLLDATAQASQQPTPLGAAKPPRAPLVPSQPPVVTLSPVAAPGVGASYVGSLTDSGERQVFMQQGNDVITLRPGQALSSGWVLERLEADRIVLRHTATNSVTALNIRSDQ